MQARKTQDFKAILGQVIYFVGAVKDRFWLYACCKMWYRCANSGVDIDETYKVVENIIYETIKLEKLKKSIIKLGFD